MENYKENNNNDLSTNKILENILKVANNITLKDLNNNKLFKNEEQEQSKQLKIKKTPKKTPKKKL
jgi:hypothetical protein